MVRCVVCARCWVKPHPHIHTYPPSGFSLLVQPDLGSRLRLADLLTTANPWRCSMSNGTILDFAGPYFVNDQGLAFGHPTM